MRYAFILLVIGVPVQRCCADEQNPSAAFAKNMAKAIQIISRYHFTPTSEAQLAEWSIRGLYKASKQPLPDAISKQFEKLGEAPDRQRLLAEAHEDLRQRRGFKANEDIDICLAAIAARLDPPERPSERLDAGACIGSNLMSNDRSIGVKLESDPKTGMLGVVTPIFNGPAYQAGIRAGDIVTEIRLDADRDGKPFLEPDNQGKPAPSPRIYSTKGMTVDEANKLLRGKAGTRVTLKVIQAK